MQSKRVTKLVPVGPIAIGENRPFVLIAGPDIVESEKVALETAAGLRQISDDLGVSIIYKSSYDKANRMSHRTFRGIGMTPALTILNKVKQQFGFPILTDVHCVEQVAAASEIADVLQIPAFLCRQTDLLVAAAKTNRAINIKKGQFMAPWDMKNALEKVTSYGNDKVLLAERGTSFGYNYLIVDMTSLPIMREWGYPVVFDAGHSVQLPGGKGASSGGRREHIGTLARAAMAVGIDALFMEVHPDPDRAPCDGPNSYPLKELRSLLKQLQEIDTVVKRFSHA